MGSLVRLLGIMAAVVGSALIAVWSGVTTVVAPLAAVTALVLGGTGHSLINSGPTPDTDEQVAAYLHSMGQSYIDPSAAAAGNSINGYVAVYSPEQFWPLPGHQLTFDQSVSMGVANLSSCLAGASSPSCLRNTSPAAAVLGPDPAILAGGYLVFGYSQSARIVTDVKRQLVQFYDIVGWEDAPELSFVVIGNPDRPNGGILERFAGLSIPFFGITFDGATPTDSGCDTSGQNCHFDTTDISRQYDGYSDFPLRPLNLLADLNAVLGIVYEHGFYDVPITDANIADGSVIDQGRYQDTQYYLIPTDTIPLLKPFVGILPAPLLAALDTPLRTIIEMGYDRSISPGVATPAQWLRFSPVRDLITVGIAVATGIDDGIALASGDPTNRPLGTTKAGPFGVPQFQWRDLTSNATTTTSNKTAKKLAAELKTDANPELKPAEPQVAGDQVRGELDNPDAAQLAPGNTELAAQTDPTPRSPKLRGQSPLKGLLKDLLRGPSKRQQDRGTTGQTDKRKVRDSDPAPEQKPADNGPEDKAAEVKAPETKLPTARLHPRAAVLGGRAAGVRSQPPA